MKVTDVRINGLENPVGISVNGSVTVSWSVSQMKADRLMLTRVLIFSDPACSNQLAEARGEDLNEEGETLEIAAEPRSRYYVKVQAVSAGKEAAESGVAVFETSKMDEAWQAQWISADDGVIPAGYLHLFTLSGADAIYDLGTEGTEEPATQLFEATPGADPAHRIVSARLYAAADSMAEVLINGTSCGMIPDPADDETAGYITANVSNLLGDDNLLEILPQDPQGPAAVIAELHIQYAGGTESVIVTDGSWMYRTGAKSDWKSAHPADVKRTLTEVPLEEAGSDGYQASGQGESPFAGGFRW